MQFFLTTSWRALDGCHGGFKKTDIAITQPERQAALHVETGFMEVLEQGEGCCKHAPLDPTKRNITVSETAHLFFMHTIPSRTLDEHLLNNWSTRRSMS